jgi:hypothetical protein
MPKQIVYVHGAGPQKPASTLKHDIDMALFGKDMSASSRIGYYANVRWPSAATPAGPALAAAASGASRKRRTKAIRATMDPTLSPNDAANEIVDATLRGPGAGVAAAAAAGPTPAEIAAAKRLVRQLYRTADKIAARSAAPPPGPGLAFGPTFPDPIFRFVVGKFASDVIDYLYGPWKPFMQAPVFDALNKTPRPKVVLAHSLGTIITYDVLADASMTGLSDVKVITIGCPLGIGNVQNRLRNGAGRPNPIPNGVTGWGNFADRWDPVALDQTMRDEFEPPKNMPVDEQVNNPAGDNHELFGYLSVQLVRDAIVAAVG